MNIPELVAQLAPIIVLLVTFLLKKYLPLNITGMWTLALSAVISAGITGLASLLPGNVWYEQLAYGLSATFLVELKRQIEAKANEIKDLGSS